MRDALEELVDRCRSATLPGEIARWKEKRGGKAVGIFPGGLPEEILHAAGILTLGLAEDPGDPAVPGACAAAGSLARRAAACEALDGILTADLCGGPASLAGSWASLFPGRLVESVRCPKEGPRAVAAATLRGEFERLRGVYGAWTRKPVAGADLRWSVGVFQRNRILTSELYALRRRSPGSLRAGVFYPLLSAARVLPCEEHSRLLDEALGAAEGAGGDAGGARVFLAGTLCAPPPLPLLEALEEGGCRIADDDLHLGRPWIGEGLDRSSDPMSALALAYAQGSPLPGSVAGEWEAFVAARVRKAAAGVVVVAPGRCPQVQARAGALRSSLASAGIPCLIAEGGAGRIRAQAAAFSAALRA